jgi:hypothetical protein
LPIEHLQQGLQILSQQNPQRFNAAMATLNRVGTIQAAQQQAEQHRAYQQREHFETQRVHLGKLADDAIGPMSWSEKTEAAEFLVKTVSKYGVSREQFLNEAKGNLLLHHPAFQKMAVDAWKYDRMQNAAKARPTPSKPPVLKPGTRVPAADREHQSVSSLQAKHDGSPEAAYKLYQARKKARG